MSNQNNQATANKWGEKLAAAAGSLTGLCLLPTGVDASVTNVIGHPVILSMSAADGSIAYWDVDSSGGSDFRLWKGGVPNAGSILLASNGSNGLGLVGPTYVTDNVQALFKSFNVGPTLANNLKWGSGFPLGYASRQAMASNSAGGFQIGFDFNNGFKEGNNFFGFRFVEPGYGVHYGVGVIDFDTANGVVTIDRWAYNTTEDAAVHVQDIPEPGTASLVLLGMGAGGVRAWRRRKQALAA